MGNVRLLGSIEAMRTKIEHQVAEGRRIGSLPRKNRVEIAQFKNQFLTWNDFNTTILKNGFESHGTLTISPANEFGSSDIQIMELKFGASKTDEYVVTTIIPVLEEKIRVLDSVRLRLEEFARVEAPPVLDSRGEDIFLVHGRDHATRETVRGFLSRVASRDVIVLDETAGEGQDILGKLLTQAGKAAFAVVLLTGDDVGSLKGEDQKPRARQNVILELGLFIGLLGREKVTVLYEAGVELPSDFLGVAYIAIDSGKGWQIDLARELRSAGIDASIDKML